MTTTEDVRVAGTEPHATSRTVHASWGADLRLSIHDQLIADAIENDGVWEPEATQLLERVLGPGTTFLDVGAHVGYFSVLAAKRGARVIAIEANPENVAYLIENANTNNVNVDIHACAVAPYPGTTFLGIDAKDRGWNDAARYVSDSGIPVVARTLADILGDERPQVAKFDIEGLEYDVLESAPEVLDGLNLVVVEFVASQADRYNAALPGVVAVLERHGFKVTDPYGVVIDGRERWGSLEIATLIARRPQVYADELLDWHETTDRRMATEIILAAQRASGARSILDVGCGLGQDLEALRKVDPTLDLLGVEQDASLRARLTVPAVADISEVSGTYDMIVAMDVLEHAPDPDALLQDMIDRLRPDGGVIVEHSPVHDAHPGHLVTNRAWHPGRLLDERGFKLQEDLSGVHIWRRETLTRVPREHILLCAYRAVSVASVDRLASLIEDGWRFSIHHGDALVSRVRSVAVSQWYKQTAGDVFLMVDDDIVFTPEDAQKVVDLAREKRSIASAAYPVRGAGHLASMPLYEDDTLHFGPTLPPVEIRWAGTGFFAVHRDVVDALVKTLPLTHATTPWSFWPMFMPFVWGEGDEANYLSEDWAFCERARRLGFQVWLDPTVELIHIGSKEYRVRDIGGATEEQAPPTEYLGA